MSRNLWNKPQYYSNLEYIVDGLIREFDISKANISVLRDANVLSEEQYQYYLKCPRQERQVSIGKLQGSNPEISNILKSGILNAKKIFMESNLIDDSDILYIRNDAIAIIGNKVIRNLLISDHVCFRQSAVYTSFYKYDHIYYYYFYDQVSKSEKLDVKGLGGIGTELHKKYMLDFLCELFYCIQIDGIEEAIKLIQNFYNNYTAKELPIDYYRELNPLSRYRLISNFSLCSTLYLDYAENHHKKYLDISYNECMLRYFIRILSTIYFNKK